MPPRDLSDSPYHYALSRSVPHPPSGLPRRAPRPPSRAPSREPRPPNSRAPSSRAPRPQQTQPVLIRDDLRLNNFLDILIRSYVEINIRNTVLLDMPGDEIFQLVDLKRQKEKLERYRVPQDSIKDKYDRVMGFLNANIIRLEEIARRDALREQEAREQEARAGALRQASWIPQPSRPPQPSRVPQPSQHHLQQPVSLDEFIKYKNMFPVREQYTNFITKLKGLSTKSTKLGVHQTLMNDEWCDVEKNEDVKCAICLDSLCMNKDTEEIDFDNAIVAGNRNCTHIYHHTCIQAARAAGNRTCPLCRAPFYIFTFPLKYLEDSPYYEDDFHTEDVSRSGGTGAIFYKKPIKMSNGKTRHYYYHRSKRISKAIYEKHMNK